MTRGGDAPRATLIGATGLLVGTAGTAGIPQTVACGGPSCVNLLNYINAAPVGSGTVTGSSVSTAQDHGAGLALSFRRPPSNPTRRARPTRVTAITSAA